MSGKERVTGVLESLDNEYKIKQIIEKIKEEVLQKVREELNLKKEKGKIYCGMCKYCIWETSVLRYCSIYGFAVNDTTEACIKFEDRKP